MARSSQPALIVLLALSLLPVRSSAANQDSVEGFIHLDVVVSDKSGVPITGLKPEDFTLFDNGQKTSLISLHSDEPAEIVLVIDALNLSSQQIAVAERQAEAFLRENNGQLAHPAMIYRLTDAGLSGSLQPASDGNELAKAVATPSSLRAVWQQGLRAVEDSLNIDYSHTRNQLSLRALGAIVIEARRRPGRKLLFWIGPGWPVDTGGENSLDEIVEFSTRIREARISLYSLIVSDSFPLPRADGGFTRAVRNPREAEPTDLALEVLAAKSGGGVLNTPPNLAKLIDACVKESGPFYSLTFDPTRAARPDEYHELKVAIDRPNVHVRNSSEYYNQPTFYDEPTTADRVSIAQLPEVFESLNRLSDSERTRRLTTMELSERLTPAAIARLKPVVHGQKAISELVVLADCSAFLPLPPSELPATAIPELHDQRLMLDHTLHYVNDITATLPNFFATRTTITYEEPAQKQDRPWKTVAADQSLHPAAPQSLTVLVRNSREVTDAAMPAPRNGNRKRSLVTEGTFGPILAMVLADVQAPYSEIKWARWEQSPQGPRAVFRYSVPHESGHYEVGFCCLADPDGTAPFHVTTGYHGEITIDPETGVVYRITAQADLAPRLPMLRSDVTVEYGPVVLGGQTYICPLHSVSISRSRTVRLLHQWNMRFGVYGPFETILDDVTFSNYHLFRSGHRILTDASPVP